MRSMPNTARQPEEGYAAASRGPSLKWAMLNLERNCPRLDYIARATIVEQ